MTTALRTKLIASCPQCGQSYQVRWVGQKFCSPLCARKSRRITRSRECPCGRTFVPRRPGHTYCSRACVAEWGRPMRAKLCPYCGVAFSTRSATQRFCSRRCCVAARRARRRRMCEFCGEPFGFIDGRRKFCSRSCALLGKRIPSGESSPNWKGWPHRDKRIYPTARAWPPSRIQESLRSRAHPRDGESSRTFLAP